MYHNLQRQTIIGLSRQWPSNVGILNSLRLQAKPLAFHNQASTRSVLRGTQHQKDMSLQIPSRAVQIHRNTVATASASNHEPDTTQSPDNSYADLAWAFLWSAIGGLIAGVARLHFSLQLLVATLIFIVLYNTGDIKNKRKIERTKHLEEIRERENKQRQEEEARENQKRQEKEAQEKLILHKNSWEKKIIEQQQQGKQKLIKIQIHTLGGEHHHVALLTFDELFVGAQGLHRNIRKFLLESYGQKLANRSIVEAHFEIDSKYADLAIISESISLAQLLDDYNCLALVEK